MAIPKNPESEIQKLVKNGNAVFVVGTGVSIGATWDPATKSAHPQASWAGLLRNGLQWLKDHKLIDKNVHKGHLAILGKSPKTRHFITIAADITEAMGADSKNYREWLEATIGKITAKNRDTLDALHAIRENGNLLATTNYDNLLLEGNSKLRPVTWMEGDELIRALRERNTDQILFLHGHWRKPQSVILDWNSYDRISRDERHRDDLKTLWASKPWIYVGCGVDGLDDPDLGLLLERYGKRHQTAGLWDYCLCTEGQREQFQSHFDEKGYNICAVSYGKGHEHLPGFLNSLLPAPAATVQPSGPQPPVPPATKPTRKNPIPPALYAIPSYAASHTFVGRQAQLDELNEWAHDSDPSNLLLYEAIGGNGKSMLTWHWLNHGATTVRSDWAGRFWYSFYEGGAVMADFCRHALAYMQGTDTDELNKLKTPELARRLTEELQARPWLIVLDGLERILVAYHRPDAASLRDEDVDTAKDQIADRNTLDTIRQEDADLLKQLAIARPSKVLVSSRLTPRVLLNPSGQAIPGVKRLSLSGLKREDAEAMFRACGINGDAKAIQDYLQTNCNNHPLVIGVLAGLVADYPPAPGNFDAWAMDATLGGAALNLAELDLTLRKEHILATAMKGLSPKSHELLSTMALLSKGANFATLQELNPHLPPRPPRVDEPEKPEEEWDWNRTTAEEKKARQKAYASAMQAYQAYQQAVANREKATTNATNLKALQATLRGLQNRGLVLYDTYQQRYDLHPVVRGVAAGRLEEGDRKRLGQGVLDHFNTLPRNPYREAKTLADVETGMEIVRAYIQVGDMQGAADQYIGGLSQALAYNLEAHVEILGLLKPFFPQAWQQVPEGLEDWAAGCLLNEVALSFYRLGEHELAMDAYGACIMMDLGREAHENLMTVIRNLCYALPHTQLPTRICLRQLCLSLATATNSNKGIFRTHLDLYGSLLEQGQWAAAEAEWETLQALGWDWPRYLYRQGYGEYLHCNGEFWQGRLYATELEAAIAMATIGNERETIRWLKYLYGEWHLSRGEATQAIPHLQAAKEMAAAVSLWDKDAAAALLLARLQVGEVPEAQDEVNWLLKQREVHHYYLARIHQHLGRQAQAIHHALKEYEWAWGAGEPYVHRYYLDRAAALLHELGEPLPVLPPYDPAKDRVFPWEKDVQALIDKLEAQKKNTK